MFLKIIATTMTTAKVIRNTRALMITNLEHWQNMFSREFSSLFSLTESNPLPVMVGSMLTFTVWISFRLLMASSKHHILKLYDRILSFRTIVINWKNCIVPDMFEN